jgi:predicted nucleic acid-binding protein
LPISATQAVREERDSRLSYLTRHAIEMLLRTLAGRRVESRIYTLSESLHTPHLIHLEVAQILRRQVAAGALASTVGREPLDDLHDLALVHPHKFFLEGI